MALSLGHAVLFFRSARRTAVATSITLTGRLRRRGRLGRRDPPNRVSDIVGDQQSATPIDRQTNRPSARVIVGIEEAGDDILRRAAGLSAAEGHEDHLVAVERRSIPASMFADEGTAAVVCRKIGAGGHRDTQGRHVRAQRVVRRDRFGHQIGPLRQDAWVEVLAVIAVGPAIEAAVLAPRSDNPEPGRARFHRVRWRWPRVCRSQAPTAARSDCERRWRKCDVRPTQRRPPRSRLAHIRRRFRFRRYCCSIRPRHRAWSRPGWPTAPWSSDDRSVRPEDR